MTAPVFIFDLDGTLLNEERRMHPRDREVLLSRSDLVLIPATGRTLTSVKTSFAENDLWADVSIPLPMITQNGSMNYLPGELEQSFFPFENNLLRELVAFTRRFPHIPALLMSKNSIHTLHTEAADPEELWDFGGLPLADWGRGQQFSKVLFYSSRPEELCEVEEASAAFPVERVYSTPVFFEMTPQGVNKGKGVGELLPALGLEGANIFAAGDGGNDLPLLKLADRTFTPSRASLDFQGWVDHVVNWEERGLLEPMIEKAGLSKTTFDRSW
jgi:HAD superfamily hydrolase (TIGR01484 family)